MSADGKLAFITSPESKELVVVDAATRADRQALQGGRGPARRRRASDATGASTSPTGTRTNSRSSIRRRARSSARSRSANSPSGVAVTPDGRLVSPPTATATRSPSSMRRRTSASAACRSASARSASPSMPSGKRAYTANVGSDDVSVIDIATRKVVAHREGRASAPMPSRSPGSAPSSPTSTPARSASSTWRA